MIPLILFIFIIAYTIMIYFKNKESDRARHRRQRLQEKKEALMESLRKHTDENKPDEN